MASVYVHLSGRDVDKVILSLYGIEMEESKKDNESLKPKKCLWCGEINPATNRVCRRCFFPLDERVEVIFEKEVERELIDAVIEIANGAGYRLK